MVLAKRTVQVCRSHLEISIMKRGELLKLDGPKVSCFLPLPAF
ncbi:hypothetical protein SB48_HM08orf05729 [Heyndrickxia coagulans]|uniref:Uncharacterized protein n=1 Tax=Heyndrickxia coagulans TaxID=1398 RepID=A0AAN0T8C7_HEYCO|nr:hypothetical protein SB48_HM08orf05729 [Heyndrickxia coagulans]